MAHVSVSSGTGRAKGAGAPAVHCLDLAGMGRPEDCDGHSACGDRSGGHYGGVRILVTAQTRGWWFESTPCHFTAWCANGRAAGHYCQRAGQEGGEVRPVLFMSTENHLLYFSGAGPVALAEAVARAVGDTGIEVRATPYCPTWGAPGPLPSWWRRWFLREERKPPERVVFVVEMP